MFRILTRLMAKSPRSEQTGRVRARLEVECLESRLVPATSAVKVAVLDFGGGTVSATEMSQGGWGGSGAHSYASFRNLFTSSRPFLDLNADLVVNGHDADLAISKILAKVQEDFAPYRVAVVSGSQDDHQHLLTNPLAGDVLVMVTGGSNDLTFSGGGVAPHIDTGNARDEIVWVFGATVAQSLFSANQFINSVARAISHEMGHAFGLKHVTVDRLDDASRHLIMAEPDGSSSVDARDTFHDFNFQDLWYPVEGGGIQNSHQYLTTTLGASYGAWAAVLQPGRLTVTGGGGNDTITVAQGAGNRWVVTLNGLSKTVDTFEPGPDSLNPFSAPLGSILILGGAGDDTITIGTSVVAGGDTLLKRFAEASVYGGSDNDTIYGGGGRDYIYGGTGNDRIYGRGGTDYLYGNEDNDFLDGGKDGLEDFLKGGIGVDTFVAEASGYGDTPQDFNALEGDSILWRALFPVQDWPALSVSTRVS